MCGRFIQTANPEKIRAILPDIQVDDAAADGFRPRYNIAPTQDVLTVLNTPPPRLTTTRWGLIPPWAKDAGIGNRMINARAETIGSKNAFRKPFERHRCIVPADGFYEWTKEPGQKVKQPWYIHRPDGEPYAFAGLWETWRGADRESEPMRSCTIITTSANEPMSKLHDRMPVILPPSAWDTWLDPENHDTEALGQLLVPAPPEIITFHPVSTEVNNARNQGAHLLDPVELVGDAGGS